jgi:hypothetical protein
MKEEDPEFETLLNDIRCAVYHMDDDQAIPIINNFIEHHPELLEVHNRDWYHLYC